MISKYKTQLVNKFSSEVSESAISTFALQAINEEHIFFRVLYLQNLFNCHYFSLLLPTLFNRYLKSLLIHLLIQI